MSHAIFISSHSQMETAANFRPSDRFLTHRSRFDRVSIRSRLLNRQLQRSRNLLWEEREHRLPDDSVNPHLNPAICSRYRGFVGDSHRILTVLLHMQSELISRDIGERERDYTSEQEQTK
jgi:hypothetical protein